MTWQNCVKCVESVKIAPKDPPISATPQSQRARNKRAGRHWGYVNIISFAFLSKNEVISGILLVCNQRNSHLHVCTYVHYLFSLAARLRVMPQHYTKNTKCIALYHRHSFWLRTRIPLVYTQRKSPCLSLNSGLFLPQFSHHHNFYHLHIHCIRYTLILNAPCW